MFFFSTNSENTDLIIEAGSIEEAYFLIVKNDLDNALLIFENLDSSRAKWGVFLISILKGFLTNYPTYFQVRNFFEIDLDYFIKNNKIEYVQMMLGASQNLVIINQEIYKYVARVMYENNYYNTCKEYLDKSKEVFFNDPELHFIYTKYYMKMNSLENALNHINECLKIVPDYYPALVLKSEIIKNLA